MSDNLIMKGTVTFSIGNIDVIGYYDKGFKGNLEQPSEPEYFEIDKIEVSGIDITEELEAIEHQINIGREKPICIISAIEELVLKQH